MKVALVTPAPPGSNHGNRVTARRWAAILRDLGHEVSVAEVYQGEDVDLLVALHARRSAESVRRFRDNHPERPIVLALTGTDLYADLGTSEEARASLESADRMIVLQSLGAEEVPAHLRERVRVIHQSVTAGRFPRPKQGFQVVVIAHLRSVKDPMRAAAASRLLPAGSAIRVVHLGAARDPDMAEIARQEVAENPRYEWRGDVAHDEVLRVLARSRVLVLSSELEGGANAVTEALACGVPVLSTRIAGSIGLLGENYPGYFPVGDTEGLRDLLVRAETDADFLSDLTERCRALAHLADPADERRRWAELLAELV